MFNPPPYVPSIHLSDTIPSSIPLNAQFGHARNMNIDSEVQRRAAELVERMARRAKEDTDSDLESDGDYYQDRDPDYDYEDRRTRRDLPDEAVFFRREQDDLEIALIERRVAEATRALEDAKRDLKEAKTRIRDRRREERQQLNERSRGSHSLPEFVRPSLDDERVGALPSGDILRC